jgi:RNA polymerase sigma-70 factor (ECF subfamily)
VDQRTADLERLYRASFARFVNVLASITGSYELGREATQEAFARALAARASYRGDGSLEGWVWRIALRAAQERRTLAPLATVAEVQELTLAEPERDPVLTAALRKLSPRRRTFVFLRYFADLSYAEIASACGVSEGTVAAALAQAKAVLGEELSKEGAVR